MLESIEPQQPANSRTGLSQIIKDMTNSDFFNTVTPQTLSMLISMSGNFLGASFISQLGYETLAINNYITTLQFFTVTPISSLISYFSNRAKKETFNDHLTNLRISWLSSWLGAGVTAAIMYSAIPLIHYSSRDQHATLDLIKYTLYFTPGIPAMFILNANRQFLLAIYSINKREHRDIHAAWFNVLFYTIYQVLDTELSYLLAFGKIGFPKMGIVGLGVANTIAIWSTIMLFRLFLYERYNVNFEFFNKKCLLDVWEKFKQHYLYGLRILIDQGYLFSLSVMLGKMGPIQQAAQEAVYQYIPILSAFIFGLKDSIGKLVGSAENNQNRDESKKITYAGIIYGLVVTGVPLALFIVWPDPFIKIFLPDQDNPSEDRHQVIHLARTLLWINGVGLMLDSVRNTCISTLVSYIDKNTTQSRLIKSFPLTLIVLTLLGGVSLAWLLGFYLHFDAIGLMTARNIVIGVGAIISFAVFYFYNNNTPVPVNSDQQTNILEEGAAPAGHIQQANALPINLQSREGWWQSALRFFGSDMQKERQPLLQNPPENKAVPQLRPL